LSFFISFSDFLLPPLMCFFLLHFASTQKNGIKNQILGKRKGSTFLDDG
jgi:hypothetical protein